MKRLVRWALNALPRPVIQGFVHVLAPAAGLLYAGRKVRCPVCGRRWRKFMPYGYVQVRENALCPGCLSLERHRMLWLWLNRETGLLAGRPLRVLHIAPERCFMHRFRRVFKEGYVTADIESPLADVKADIRALPFPDGGFDLVLCNHILEHIDDDRLALRELYRVMAPGATGIVLCPVDESREHTYEDFSITAPEGRREAFGQPDHVRIYGRDYADRLREAGFEVRSLDYAGTLPAAEKALYGIGGDILYTVKKPVASH